MATFSVTKTTTNQENFHEVIRVSDVISALSFALDLTEGQPLGHSVRTCVLGVRLGKSVGLSQEEESDLYYALLLKDSGCSSNAERIFQIMGSDDRKAKREMKLTNWSRLSAETFNYARHNLMPHHSPLRWLSDVVRTTAKRRELNSEIFSLKCERGAHIAAQIGFSDATSAGIYSMDEHWDGSGYPQGLEKEQIPLISRIINISQTLDLFASVQGTQAAFEVIKHRSGKWFDPELVRAAKVLERNTTLWKELQEEETARRLVMELEPVESVVPANEASLDNICNSFAEIVDAKSHYTYQHSTGVAAAAVAIASKLGLPQQTIVTIRRAALLHDIGKLSLPNTILDRPARLTASEWEAVRLHPYYTQRILEQIHGFQELAFVASTHHERLDGSGYYRNLRGDDLPLPCRVVAVADVFDALSAARPYRQKLPKETVFEMMAREVPHALDLCSFEALKAADFSSRISSRS